MSKMATKAIAPAPDGLAADNHAPLGQNILNIRRAHCQAVVRSDSVDGDLHEDTESLLGEACWMEYS